MYHMHVWKKWTTPRPGPWGCCSCCSPGPSIWPLSSLKLWNWIPLEKVACEHVYVPRFENKKYDRLLSGKNHFLVDLCLLWVNAVHYEAHSEPHPFKIMSATTMKNFRKRSRVNLIIFTEIRSKKKQGGHICPLCALNRVMFSCIYRYKGRGRVGKVPSAPDQEHLYLWPNTTMRVHTIL